MPGNMDRSMVGSGPQAIVARQHIEDARPAGRFEAAVLVSFGNVRFDLRLGCALGAEFCLVQFNRQKCLAAFSVVAHRLNRRFSGLYEMPANQTAHAVGAFACLLVTLGAKNINSSLIPYSRWAGTQGNGN